MPVATAEPDLLRGLAVTVGDAADAALTIAGSAARLTGDISPVLAVDPVARWGAAWCRSLAERADLLEAMAPVVGRLIDAYHLTVTANGADHALTTTLAVPWEDLDGAVNAAAGAVDWLLAHQPAPVIAGFLASLDAAVATALARRRPRSPMSPVYGSTWSSPPTGNASSWRSRRSTGSSPAPTRARRSTSPPSGRC